MGSVELGRALRGARLERELSFREAAALAGLALSHLQRLEGGRVLEPSPLVLQRLALALAPAGQTRRFYARLMALAGYWPGPVG